MTNSQLSIRPRSLPIQNFNKVKFWNPDPHGLAALESETRDVIHVRPARKSKHGEDIGVRVPGADSMSPPSACFRVAQVWVVFKIPSKCHPDLFPRPLLTAYPQHLAYVEWFTPLTVVQAEHGLYKLKVTRALRYGACLESVVPVSQLERSCHLFPDFGPQAACNPASLYY
ncbi:hypothetical protein C8Q74DRAFT_1268270 [Fomes fomentarius]|nr:hypothetical protein C8Q74DRAFT_1268270 [Fomes fomentarius]